MDSDAARAGTVTEFARSVGERADDLRSALQAGRQRHRMDVLRARARHQRAALAVERRQGARRREQAEIDRETRCSARRLNGAPGTPRPAHWSS